MPLTYDDDGNCLCDACMRVRFGSIPQVTPVLAGAPTASPISGSTEARPDDLAPTVVPTVEMLRIHGREVAFGTPLDPDTGGPVGCECAVCIERRREAVRTREYNLRLARIRKAANELAIKLNQACLAGKIPYCKVCTLSTIPVCERCGLCTRRGVTADQVQAFMLTQHFKEPEDYEGEYRAWREGRAREDTPSALELWLSTYTRGCCRCAICASCNKMMGNADKCTYCGLHILCGACRCEECTSCGVRRERRATPARKCTYCTGNEGCCCHCVKCPSCSATMPSSIRGPAGDLLSNRCQNCGKCLSCCRCVGVNLEKLPMPVEMQRGVVYQRAIMKLWDPSPSWGLVAAAVPHPNQRNPFKRYIGQEIEVGGNGTINMNRIVVQNWKGAIVSDGSLPSTGFEINTAPAAGDMFVKQISEIVAECERTKVWVDQSCGLHTHVDASDFNIWAVRRLINLYRRVEDHLYSMLPPSRQNNTYCEKCGDSWWKIFNDPGKIRELKSRTTKGPTVMDTSAPVRALKGNLTRALYGNDPNKCATNAEKKAAADRIKRSKRNKGNDTRYRGLNVHSWMLRGTFEFRMGAPAIDIKKTSRYDERPAKSLVTGDYIVNWGVVCAAVVDAAARWSDAQVNEFGKVMSSTSAICTWEEFRDQILPPSIRKWADETRFFIKNQAVNGGSR